MGSSVLCAAGSPCSPITWIATHTLTSSLMRRANSLRECSGAGNRQRARRHRPGARTPGDRLHAPRLRVSQSGDRNRHQQWFPAPHGNPSAFAPGPLSAGPHAGKRFRRDSSGCFRAGGEHSRDRHFLAARARRALVVRTLFSHARRSPGGREAGAGPKSRRDCSRSADFTRNGTNPRQAGSLQDGYRSPRRADLLNPAICTDAPALKTAHTLFG